ncbi:hypothetical protein CTAYLR_003407 [Chrysophaeum taylorii]|uniref:Uncharacterized protein n=1 Tax=Chrysophaeum taylorii TaxID=2483200 RepID=A0AAD7U7J5_9STRA|nr:hypothetical protein CTAYLR_003407 [Chrysophaeum taylorii]
MMTFFLSWALIFGPIVSAFLAPTLDATSEGRRLVAAPTLADTEFDLPGLNEPLATTRRRPPSDFELNLGRSLDAIRSDFPEFMDRELDWDVYARDVQLVDPSGVQVVGLDKFKQILSTIRLMRRMAMDDVSLRFRLRYDWTRRTVVVNWYSTWYWKGTTSHPLRLDAVTYFDLDDDARVQRIQVDRFALNNRGHRLPANSLVATFFAKLQNAGRKAPVPAF